MTGRLRKSLCGAAFLGAAAFALDRMPVQAESPRNAVTLPATIQPRPPCPPICPPPEGWPLPSSQPAPATETPAPVATPAPEITPGLSLASGSREGIAVPNLQGNLLGAGRSVAFFINRAQGAVFVNAFGATSITNVKIGDNNSPEPRDRVAFRYNHFDDALSVTGISSDPPFFDPSLGPAARRQNLQTRTFHVDTYTLSLEKTFLDRLLSVEARLPFGRTLSSDLNLRVGRIQQIDQTRVTDQSGQVFRGIINPTTGEMGTIGGTDAIPAGFVPLNGYTVERTPLESQGKAGNELGNLTLIVKAVLWEEPGKWLLSSGLGIGVPTADDTRVRVTDYLGGRTSIFAEVHREREFVVKNETWSLSPFVAALATPTDWFFTQGFVQLDLPVNDSAYTFSSTFPGFAGRAPAALRLTPVFETGRLREQTLLHLDVGVGCWLLRNPNARWITGLAPTAELHYTTTLDDADLVNLPNDGSQRRIGDGRSAPAPGPQLGNLRNRVDILDLTLGTTVEIAQRATLATGVALPLRRSDRTFDWELQVQFNLYFGGSGPRSGWVPNF